LDMRLGQSTSGKGRKRTRKHWARGKGRVGKVRRLFLITKAFRSRSLFKAA